MQNVSRGTLIQGYTLYNNALEDFVTNTCNGLCFFYRKSDAQEFVNMMCDMLPVSAGTYAIIPARFEIHVDPTKCEGKDSGSSHSS